MDREREIERERERERERELILNATGKLQSHSFNFSFLPETLQLKGRHSNKSFKPTFSDFLPVVKLTASLQAGCNTQPCQWKKNRQLLGEDEGGGYYCSLV